MPGIWDHCADGTLLLSGFVTGGIGSILYGMLLWSYTYAVFKKPGSPLDNV